MASTECGCAEGRTSMSKSSMFSRTAASKVSCSKRGQSGDHEGLAGAASGGSAAAAQRCPAGDQAAIRGRCRSCCTARMSASRTAPTIQDREAKHRLRVHGFSHLRDALGACEFGKLLRAESRHFRHCLNHCRSSLLLRALRADRQPAGQLDRSCSTN